MAGNRRIFLIHTPLFRATVLSFSRSNLCSTTRELQLYLTPLRSWLRSNSGGYKHESFHTLTGLIFKVINDRCVEFKWFSFENLLNRDWKHSLDFFLVVGYINIAREDDARLSTQEGEHIYGCDIMELWIVFEARKMLLFNLRQPRRFHISFDDLSLRVICDGWQKFNSFLRVYHVWPAERCEKHRCYFSSVEDKELVEGRVRQ